MFLTEFCWIYIYVLYMFPMRYELWLPTRIVTLGASTPGASHPTSHTDCRCRPAGKTWKTLCCLPNLATPNQLSPKWCWIKWTKKIGRDGLKCKPAESFSTSKWNGFFSITKGPIHLCFPGRNFCQTHLQEAQFHGGRRRSIGFGLELSTMPW